jgi:hypothetical protein
VEVEVLEQLLGSAVQGNRLEVKVTIKQREQQSESDGEEIRNSTEQEYRDVHSRVVAARGEANTPRLTIELGTEEEEDDDGDNDDNDDDDDDNDDDDDDEEEEEQVSWSLSSALAKGIKDGHVGV